MNNLKQLQLAWVMYSGDFNDFLASGRLGRHGKLLYRRKTCQPDLGSWQYGWSPEHHRHGGYRSPARGTRNAVPYLRNINVYKCSADRKQGLAYSSPLGWLPTTRSMSMNSWLNPPAGSAGGTSGRIFRKQSDLSTHVGGPVKLFVTVDENQNTSTTATFLFIQTKDPSIRPLGRTCPRVITISHVVLALRMATQNSKVARRESDQRKRYQHPGGPELQRRFDLDDRARWR